MWLWYRKSKGFYKLVNSRIKLIRFGLYKEIRNIYSNKQLECKTKTIQFIIVSENIKYVEYILQKMCKTSILKIIT